MFPLIENGPVIPAEILNAWQEDKIIFLCGAGISYYSKLPGFADLAEDVFRDLCNGPKLPHEEEAVEDRHWDTFLGHLENRFGADKVRKSIAKRLLIESPGELDFHKALLTLSKTADGGTRLVTTNFDRRFFECGAGNFSFNTAPLLPLPKRSKWNSVVFLHGLLQDEISADNSNIVFSASDFGAAYLTEGWGTRFITELFREFTVVFVGYSLTDPVVFYLVTALASESKASGNFKGAYAFAGYNSSEPNDKIVQESRWTNKGVTPILFDSSNNYSLLKDTFIEWSKQSSNGMLSREQIFREASERKPNDLVDSEPIANRLIWSLYDNTGNYVRKFAAQTPTPKLEWFLQILDKTAFSHPLFNGDEFKLSELSAWSQKDMSHGVIPILTSYVQEQDDFTEQAKLHSVSYNIMLWLAKHLNDKRLLNWFLERGCRLHQEVKEIIQIQLWNVKVESLSEEEGIIYSIWNILTSNFCALPAQNHNIQTGDFTQAQYTANSTEWKIILEQFDPFLKLRPGFSWIQTESISFRDYATSSITLPASEFAYNLVGQIGQIIEVDKLLAYSADDITSKLKRALDLFALVQEANQDIDPSYLDRPSISEHEQNENASSWTALIELAIKAFDAQVRNSPEDALVLFQRWSRIGYPIFKRLCLYACTEHESFDANLGVHILTSDNTLWNNAAKREVFKFLRVAAARLTDKNISILESHILNGPIYKSNNKRFTKKQLATFAKEEIIIRLRKLATNPTIKLCQKSNNMLQKQSQVIVLDSERDEFPIWFSEHNYNDDQPPFFRFDKQNSTEIIATLVSHPESASASCYQLICDHPEKFFEIMTDDSQALLSLPGFCNSMMRGFSALVNKNDYLIVDSKIVDLVSAISNEQVAEQASSLSDFIDALSKNRSKISQEEFLGLWDKAMQILVNDEANLPDFSLSSALYHPVGILTNSLLRWVGKVDKHTNFPEWLVTRLNTIVDKVTHASWYAQMILTLNLCFLHFGDSDWTNEKILPLLDWSNPNAKNLWRSFLHNNQWYPDLFSDLKNHLADCFSNQDDLGPEKKNLVELWVMAMCSSSSIFPPTLVADICHNLTESNLTVVATRLKKTLEQSNEQKMEIWKESVAPCLKKIWPNDLSRQTEQTSKALASLAIEADTMFDDAVELVSQHLVKCSNISAILHLLEKKKIALRHPQACLLMTYKLIDQSRALPGTLVGLRQILLDLRTASKEIATSAKYQQLETLLSKLS
ncbi:MAG: SIR2 family protein [Candidatus Obscuribacterales bacterium]